MTSTGPDLADILTPLALIAVVALAVRQDLVEHRISNVLTLSALSIALLIHVLTNGVGGMWHALSGAGVGLLCLLPLYLCKGMGAGDVKLMAATGAFLGPYNAFIAALLSLVLGAVLGIIIFVWRLSEIRAATVGASGTTNANAQSPISSIRKERFPYAVAIGLGVVATIWLRGMLDGVLS